MGSLSSGSPSQIGGRLLRLPHPGSISDWVARGRLNDASSLLVDWIVMSPAVDLRHSEAILR